MFESHQVFASTATSTSTASGNLQTWGKKDPSHFPVCWLLKQMNLSAYLLHRRRRHHHRRRPSLQVKSPSEEWNRNIFSSCRIINFSYVRDFDSESVTLELFSRKGQLEKKWKGEIYSDAAFSVGTTHLVASVGTDHYHKLYSEWIDASGCAMLDVH